MTLGNTMKFVLSGAAVALLLTLAAPPAPGAPDEAPSFRVRAVEGTPLRGRLTAWDGETLALETASGVRSFPLGQVLGVTAEHAPPPTLGSRPHLRVTLTGGEVVVGTYAGATSDGLALETPDLGRVPLLLDVVSTVVAVHADAGACFEPEHRHPARDDDVAYVQSGDEFAGIVLAVSDEGFELETDRGRTRLVSWDDLLVLHLQNDPPDPLRGVVVEVETVEGSRLTAAGELTLVDGALGFGLRSSPSTKIRVPLASVRAIRPSGGAFVYASMLPFESEFVPYYRDDERQKALLESWFAARVDRRPTGCPLRLDGRTYRHGFAVHARSILTLRIDKGWRRFDALFGVDDEALEVDFGSVVNARVLGDDKVLWEARDVRAGETPRRVGPLDLEGVEVLVLEVDFGKDLHFRDRAAWVDPLLFR